MDAGTAARFLRAGYQQGYAQGRADAETDVNAVCEALPTTTPAVRRLVLAAARGARDAPQNPIHAHMSASSEAASEEDTRSVWAEIIGPIYTLPGVARHLGLKESEVLARIQTHDLWALTTSDGAIVVPASQFNDDNTVLDGLPEILRVFADAGQDSGWTLASALNGKWEELGDRSPLECLREQPTDSPITVLQWAQRTARRWSQ